MDNYAKSVVPIIEANYDSFTPMEKNIADFFIANKEKKDFSAKAISKELFVSEASLSRFSQKCGFRGYREFIYQYEEFFGKKAKAMTGYSKTVLDTYQELLNKTYNLIDEKQLIRVSRMIHKAGKIYICGKGSSGIAAQEMKLRLMRIGFFAEAISDGDVMRMQSVSLTKDALVIGVSMSAGSRDIAYMLKQAKKKGASTVLLTARNDQEDNTVNERVLLASRTNLDYGNMISPQFPVLVMIDLIYSYIMEQDKEQKQQLHKATMEALEEMK